MRVRERSLFLNSRRSPGSRSRLAPSSEQDVVDVVLRGYLADVHELRASLQEAIAEDDAGGGVDGKVFMAELLTETETRAAAQTKWAASAF